MIPITIGGESYIIPTSWRDITYKKFCEIISLTKDDNYIQLIEVVSNIPCNTIEKLDEESLIILQKLLNFMQDFDTLNDFNIPTIDINIGKESWEKLIRCQNAMQGNDNVVCVAGEMLKVYCGKVINDIPITECFGDINYIIKQINEFFKRYERLGDYEQDEDEFQANSDRFKRFGFFASCVEISRKMGQSYETTLQMSATDIYQTLLYDFERSDYEKTLMRIKSNKK